jgi:hypothetical protein
MPSGRWTSISKQWSIVVGGREEARAKEKRTKLAMVQILEGVLPSPHDLWASQTSVLALTNNAPAPPGMSPFTRISPPLECVDNDPHNGLNPNSFVADRTWPQPNDVYVHTNITPPYINIWYDGSPTMRCVPLPTGDASARGAGSSQLLDDADLDARNLFGGMSHSNYLLAELIQTGSHSVAYTQEY